MMTEIQGIQEVLQLMKRVKTNINRVVIGKEQVIDQLLIAMVCSGHVLLEDVPGTGKTLLAKTLAKSLACDFKRIQFTPDLLPTDLSGINFYNQKLSEFEFRPGPVFTNILLADEINRATPRTQASMLECMEERQVSIDGETHRLAQPFLVIATQNPLENQGTFPLPEAQLDRFLIKIRMGYPTAVESMDILKRFKNANPLDTLEAEATAADIVKAQNGYSTVYVSDPVLQYMIDLAEQTRRHPDIATGISPRGLQALLKAAQAHAILRERAYASPDDVKAMIQPVWGHRIWMKGGSRNRDELAGKTLGQIVAGTPVPAEEALIGKEA